MTRRVLVEPEHPDLSISRQCELLGLSRSSSYYQPATETPENLEYMGLIDVLYTARPDLGSRQMRQALGREHQLEVNRKRVQRLMRLMNISSVLPRPGTSKPAPEYRIYPYLLRNVPIVRVNQVWSTDITSIPVVGGWVYRVAIMDWFSRDVLSWELSNSMDVGFCLSALEHALDTARPEVFNTDQGAQFTRPRFLEPLESSEVQISMDGKGRGLDHVWVERLWRTIKYEEVYLREYADPVQAWEGLHTYIEYYNQRRAHSSLNHATPAEVYVGHRLLN